MPPKAEKKPTTAGKAPAGKAPTDKKEAGKKTAPPTGDKKRRSKTRKETYSSYIYKGHHIPSVSTGRLFVLFRVCFLFSCFLHGEFLGLVLLGLG
jgi:hypothetical protein